MKIIVCGASEIRDEQWVFSVLSEYCRKNRVTAIATGQEDGPEHDAVLFAMQRKFKLHVVPTQKKDGDKKLLERNVEIIRKHPDAIAILHFQGDKVSEHLCRAALKANIPVDDVTRK